MARKKKTNKKDEEIDFVDKLIECSNDNCPVWTEIVVPSDYDTRRIDNAHAETGFQILQIKFNSAEHRKALLQKAKKLRESLNFKNVYIQPDLTKSEREMQFKLREEKRQLQAKNPRKN